MVQSKNKKIHLELLRILAIFFVIFNHTSPEGYLGFASESNAVLYGTNMFLSVLCKVGVPIFFMISGALLLGKQESLRVLYKKRVLRIAVVLLLISVPNYILLSGDSPRSMFGFFRTIYTDTARTALWYLYAYICFLIMLPFIRAMAAQLKRKDYRYLLAVHIVLSVFLLVTDKFVFTKGHNPYISVAIALESSLFYPLMGYYIEHIAEKSSFNKKNYLLAGALSVAAIAATCVTSQIYYTVFAGSLDNAAYQTFFEMLICIPALSLFFILKGTVRIKHEGFLSRLIMQLGGAVFGLYLIENFCRLLLSPVILKYVKPLTGDFAAAVLVVITTMITGFAVICLLKNLPLVKKLVNKFI